MSLSRFSLFLPGFGHAARDMPGILGSTQRGDKAGTSGSSGSQISDVFLEDTTDGHGRYRGYRGQVCKARDAQCWWMVRLGRSRPDDTDADIIHGAHGKCSDGSEVFFGIGGKSDDGIGAELVAGDEYGFIALAEMDTGDGNATPLSFDGDIEAVVDH